MSEEVNPRAVHKNSIRKDNQLSEQLISNRKQNLKRRKKKRKKTPQNFSVRPGINLD